jgi:hypothetical protein
MLFIKHWWTCELNIFIYVVNFIYFDAWITHMISNKLSFQNVSKLNTFDKMNVSDCHHILTKIENVWKSNKIFWKLSN